MYLGSVGSLETNIHVYIFFGLIEWYLILSFARRLFIYHVSFRSKAETRDYRLTAPPCNISGATGTPLGQFREWLSDVPIVSGGKESKNVGFDSLPNYMWLL
jgi:hypothetical protein